VMADEGSPTPWPIRARSDEPAVSRDSDGDGVVDFDESQRFGTNPRAKDNDGDGVADKQDIRAWVFDEKLGDLSPLLRWFYADKDQDGKRMEVDADSDGGGCLDGMEDSNGNGKQDAGRHEIYNFDEGDDSCLFGSYEWVTNTSTDSSTVSKTNARWFAQFSVRPVGETTTGHAIVTWYQRSEFHEPSGVCVLTTDPYQYVVDVSVRVVNTGDGSVTVIVSPLDGSTAPTVRAVSTCAGVDPIEMTGESISIGGTLRNGVYDMHEDLPLPAETTGAIYHEVHMRQRSRSPQ